MNQEQTMYYIGGLFDGEGSCGVYKCYGNGMGSPQLSCTINMTTMDGINIFVSIFGGVISEREVLKKNSKNIFRISYSCNKAESVLLSLLPYVIVKKRQIEIVLNYWNILKTAPRWERPEIINKYRTELINCYPSGSRKGGGRGPDRKSRKSRINTLQIPNEYKLLEFEEKSIINGNR